MLTLTLLRENRKISDKASAIDIKIVSCYMLFELSFTIFIGYETLLVDCHSYFLIDM